MAVDPNPSDTPLLLIAWRRPHTLRQVIDAIRPVAPTRLYVACDGPNPERPGEAEKVAATRQVIEQEIDWPCQIERLYSDVNQGCRLGPSRAISWFFDQVEEGIILEDDCVPHPDFLQFCSELLARYRDDNRIFLVTGHNLQGDSDYDEDYFFSRLGGIWGWATWRRAWGMNDGCLATLEEAQSKNILENVIDISLARARYTACESIVKGELDAWDYDWGYCRLINSGLSCVPRISLVSNIGSGSDATHTFEMRPIPASPRRLRFPLDHPRFIVPRNSYDQIYTSNTGLAKKRVTFTALFRALFIRLLH